MKLREIADEILKRDRAILDKATAPGSVSTAEIEEHSAWLANRAMEMARLVLAARPEVEQHTADTERFFHVCEGFDGMGERDFHERAGEVAARNGRDEPTRGDYLIAYREVVDEAMRQPQNSER